MIRLSGGVLALTLVATASMGTAALAEGAKGSCKGLKCAKAELGGGGGHTGMTESQTRSLPKTTRASVEPKPEKDKPDAKPTVQEVQLEYTTRLACPGNNPERDDESTCAVALAACDEQDAPGPLSQIYRRSRPADPAQEPSAWTYVGRTCFPTVVPNSDARPRLTLAMIRSAWERTPFSKPAVSTQPVGGRTLVTLPAYFQLQYPATGFQPDEINTVTLLGHQVRIKPVFKANSFSYGDGASSGPTTSGGGVYPTGDITHAYDKAGKYTVGVSTTYGGQYSVDGGAWADIDGAITVAGPTSTIEVVTTKNELVNE